MISSLIRYALLGQWAVLLYFLGDGVLIIFAQTQLGGFYPRGCFPIGYTESISTFFILLFGFIGTFFLQRVRWIWPFYLAWTALVIASTIEAFVDFLPPFLFSDFLIILYTVTCALALFAFLWTRFRGNKSTEPSASANSPTGS